MPRKEGGIPARAYDKQPSLRHSSQRSRRIVQLGGFPTTLDHYLDSTISSTSFFHHPIDSFMASTADIWSLLSTVFNVCFSSFNRTVRSLKG